MNKLEELLYLSELGYYLIPTCSHDHEGMNDYHKEHCSSPGKACLLSGWESHEKLDKDDIMDIYEEHQNINWAMIVGKVSPSMHILSIDMDGNEGFEWKRNNEFRLPKTLAFTTGNGCRLLYKLPNIGVFKQEVIKPASGHNEIRFACGDKLKYTILANSTHHSGKMYEWEEGCSPSEQSLTLAPSWITEMLRVQVKPGQSTRMLTSETPDDTVLIEEGARNESMIKLIGSWIGKAFNMNLSKEDVLKQSLRHNTTHVTPPIQEDEIKSMVERMWEKEELVREEEVKQKLMSNPSGEQLSPDLLASMFLEYIPKIHIGMKYHEDRDRFYITSIMKPCWKMVEELRVHSYISEFLNNIDRSLNLKRNRAEIIESLRIKMSMVDEDCYNAKNCDISENTYMNIVENEETVCVKNGIYAINSNRLLKWDYRTHNHSIMLDVDYKPRFNQDIMNLWKNSLKSWLNDEDTISFIQEYMGYCLITRNELRTMVFLEGHGANGKSLFLEIVQNLFSSTKAIIVPSYFSTSQFATAELSDKALYICPDMDSEYLEKTGIIKQITAGDLIRAEIKGGKSYHLRPVGKMLISVNKMPQTKDTSHGFNSRMRIVPFPNTFEPDSTFKVKMERTFSSDEGRNVLFHWMLEGYRRLTANKDKWTKSENMEKVKKRYMVNNDVMLEFINDAIVNLPDGSYKSSDQHTFLQRGALYEVYKHWCIKMGYKVSSSRVFSTRLVETGMDIVPIKILCKGKSYKSVRAIKNRCLYEEGLSDECIAIYFENCTK